MKLQLIVLVLSAVVSGTLAGLNCYGMEVGIADVPMHVSVQFENKHICSGAIISKDWVLTAAHCVADWKTPLIRTGTAYRDVSTSDHIVKRTVFYKDYYVHDPDASFDDYDIALLEVDPPFVIDKIRKPAVLANQNEEVPDGAQASVSGYARWIDGPPPPMELNRIHVNVISRSRCLPNRPTLKSRQFCTNRIGHCVGDTGGPLLVYGRLFGIFSSDMGCNDDRTMVYTDIGQFRNWIKETSNV